MDIKEKYLEQQARRDRNDNKIEKSYSYFSMGKPRDFPAALFSGKSKTFKQNQRKGL